MKAVSDPSSVALDATPLTIATGGIARYTAELSRALASAFPACRFTLVSDQRFSLPVRAANLHAGQPATGLRRRWWLYGLPRTLREQGVDVFHGTDFSVPYWHAVPAVVTIHDLSPWIDAAWHHGAGRIRQRLPWLLRTHRADLVITPSQAVCRQVLARFPLSPSQVVAVPLAAGAQFGTVPRTAAAPAQTPYLLYVGTIEPRKNIATVLEAWRTVAREVPLRLMLAGRIRQDQPPLAPEPSLEIRGAVSEAELPSLYAGALACVYPSFYEGFGLPVLEALQCGTPVIASQDAALKEVTGGAALHADAHSVAAWVEAIRAVATDDALRQRLSEQGRARARGFSWERTARETFSVYEEAVKRFHHAAGKA